MCTEFVVGTGGEDAGIMSVNAGVFWSCTLSVARFFVSSRSKWRRVESSGAGIICLGLSGFSGGTVVVTGEFVLAGMLAGCAAALDTGFSGGTNLAWSRAIIRSSFCVMLSAKIWYD